MQKQDNIFTLQFPEAKNIIVSGDIHGDFNLLVNKLCVQYEMRDTVLIVAGDCGFGFEQKGYYENEAPIYDADMLNAINERYAIDTVITHTAPSFCELQSKNGLTTWAANDEGNLMADVEEERQAMDDIHEHLLYNNHPINHWCYGHFHQSWHSAIGEILFKMLDIMEFYEIR